MTPGGERSRVGGRTCRSRPGGKGLGGNGLGGLVWVWVGSAWAGYFALSLPTAAAAAAAGEASAARAGFFPRLRGVLGAAAWPAEAVSRPAGVAAAAPRVPSSFSFAAVAAADEAPVARAVATPRAPFLLSSAAAAALGDAPGSCAGAAPRVGGVPGAAVGAAAWLAAVSASCVSGRGGAAGLAAWAAGAVASAGPGSRAGGGGPTSTAASASLRSSRSARVSPVHSGEETGERERDRRWWRSSRWGDPSESAITVTLVGMRGGRRALPTTSWCISAVPWAVPCGALRGGGGEGVGGRLWRQPRTAGGLRPSTSIGRGGRGTTRPTCSPQLPVWGGAQGLGPLGGSSSSASPGKEKRSAGDRRRDRKWREYQESLAAEAAQGARGGTPAHSPQRANGRHHPGHTTLGDFLEVAKQARAKPRPLLLRKSGPSSDVESAHRGRMPADQASSSSSVAPHQRDVARACERTCGVPCNLRVARQRATQQNAAVEGAVGIAHEEATEWGRGMDYHASTVAAIAAGLTAAAAHEAVAARIRGEVAATAEEARLTQEAFACKEAEVKALEVALAQERAKKEAEERAHAEATAKAQADAAKKDAIEAARRKVAEERAKTKAELAVLEAEKARLQQAREAEAARAREEAEGRAAAATAAAMEEEEAKLRRETPRGGSRVETLRKLFEGDASSKMTLDEADTGSSGSSGTTAYRRRKGKGKTPERPRRPAGGHPHDSDPFFTASDGDEQGRRHCRGVAGGGGGDVPMEPEGEDEDPLPPYRSSESSGT